MRSISGKNVLNCLLFSYIFNFLGPFNLKYMFTKKLFCCVFLSLAMMPFLKGKCSFHTCVSSTRNMSTLLWLHPRTLQARLHNS